MVAADVPRSATEAHTWTVSVSLRAPGDSRRRPAAGEGAVVVAEDMATIVPARLRRVVARGGDPAPLHRDDPRPRRLPPWGDLTRAPMGDHGAMAGPASEGRFYGELAAWWPLISPAGEYAEEAAFAAELLASAEIPVREVLELGSGGGHNAVHLARRFRVTLVDLSPEMLAVSRRLNPGCEHHVGDMRTVRLGRAFDAVFVHDAIAYMTDEEDLRLAIGTAAAHCRPGGVVVVMPDETAERFEPRTDHGGSDAPDGRGARYLQWSWDPDPADTWIVTEYAFLLREADGSVRAVHDTHRTGLFPRATWLAALGDAGLRAHSVEERTTEDRTPREVFVGRRPAAPGG